MARSLNRQGLGPTSRQYGLVLGAVLIATAVAVVLNQLVGHLVSAPYIVAVLAVARYGGLLPSLAATVLSVLAATLLVVEPVFSLWPIEANDLITLVTLVVVALFGSWITAELRAAQERERQQRDWLQTTLSSIGDAVIATDADGTVTLLNPVAESLTGWSSTDAVGRPAGEVLQLADEDTGQPIESPVTRVLRDASTAGLAGRTVVVTRDGSSRPIDDSSAPINDADGAVIGSVLVFRDISERRRDEARLRYLAEVGELLNASLDYRATLQVVARLAVPTLADWAAVDMLQPDGSLERLAVEHQDPSKVELAHELQRRYPPAMDDATGVPNVLRTGEPEYYPDIPDELLVAGCRDAEHLRIARELGLKSAMILPLKARGRMLGAISFVWAESDYRYDAADLTFAQDIARRAALAVDNARLYQASTLAEDRYRLAAQSVKALIYDWDLVSGHVERSEGLVDVVGFRPDEVPPTSAWWLERIHPDDRALFRGWRELASDRHEVEYRVRHRDGRYVPVWDHGTIQRNEQGDALRIVGSSIPMTERKQAEEALRESEERLRAVWESASDGMALSDPDGTVLAANPAYVRLLGYPPDQVLGRSFSLIFAEDQRAAAAERYREVFAADERVASFEAVLQRADGSVVPVEARYDFVMRDGQRTAMISIIRDISERRALEQMRSEFTSMVSHELRNPLAAMRGFAQLMQRRGTYSERAVEAILTQSSQMERLIGDLLDVSRLEAGALDLRPEPIDLVARVRTCADEARAAAQHHTIRVEAPVQPVVGTWDGDRLSQILRNLLGNAVKYSPDGGEIVVRVEDHENTSLVSIRDNGFGIEAHALAKLFDRFYRSDAVSASVHGLGLGLYISKELVEAHGGRIWAESAGPGRGSTFYVELPKAAGP